MNTLNEIEINQSDIVIDMLDGLPVDITENIPANPTDTIIEMPSDQDLPMLIDDTIVPDNDQLTTTNDAINLDIQLPDVIDMDMNISEEDMNKFIEEFNVINNPMPEERFLAWTKQVSVGMHLGGLIIGLMSLDHEFIHENSCKRPDGSYNILKDIPMLSYLGSVATYTASARLLAHFDLFPEFRETMSKLKEPILETASIFLFLDHFKKTAFLPGKESIIPLAQMLLIVNGLLDSALVLFENNTTLQEAIREHEDSLPFKLGAGFFETFQKTIGLGTICYETAKIFTNIMIYAYMQNNLPELEIALQGIFLLGGLLGFSSAFSEKMEEIFKYTSQVGSGMSVSWIVMMSLGNCLARGLHPELNNEDKFIWAFVSTISFLLNLNMSFLVADAEQTLKKAEEENNPHENLVNKPFKKDAMMHRIGASFFAPLKTEEKQTIMEQARNYGTMDDQENDDQENNERIIISD